MWRVSRSHTSVFTYASDWHERTGCRHTLKLCCSRALKAVRSDRRCACDLAAVRWNCYNIKSSISCKDRAIYTSTTSVLLSPSLVLDARGCRANIEGLLSLVRIWLVKVFLLAENTASAPVVFLRRESQTFIWSHIFAPDMVISGFKKRVLFLYS